MTKNDFSWPDDNEDNAAWPDDNDEEFSWPDDEEEEEEFDPGCGFSVVCRPTPSTDTEADDDADAQTVTVAIPRALMLDLLGAMKGVEWSAGQREAAGAFFNRLAELGDAEYRLKAAASPLLRGNAALQLLKDPAHDVRLALAQNVDAQALLSTDERLLLSEKDVDVRSALLESALKNWEKACRQDEELVLKLRGEAQVLATESLRHASPNVCDAAADVLEKLEKNMPAAPANDTVSPSALAFWNTHKQSARFEELLAARSRWAFFLVEDDGDEEEGAELTLPYPALQTLASKLAVSEFHDGALLLERLACHPDRFIRAAVAGRDDVPIEVYARFKAETDYLVRKALLTNPNALEVMSDETMERLVGNDPMLLCEAYKQTESEKLDELMTKLYGFWGENGDKMVEVLKSKKLGDAVDQALDEL